MLRFFDLEYYANKRKGIMCAFPLNIIRDEIKLLIYAVMHRSKNTIYLMLKCIIVSQIHDKDDS